MPLPFSAGDTDLLATEQTETGVGEQHPGVRRRRVTAVKFSMLEADQTTIRAARLAGRNPPPQCLLSASDIEHNGAHQQGAPMIDSSKLPMTAAVTAIVAFGIYRRVRRNIGRQALTAPRQ